MNPNIMRHEYRDLSPSDQAQILQVKDLGRAFYEFVDTLGSTRELSLAKTKIEEAVMWATKHLSA